MVEENRTAGEAVIRLEDVKKSYGSHEVLKGVSMQVNRGDIYGLIGRNGAGKTTIFKMILGLSEVSGGTVSICGSTTKKELYANRSGIGFLVGTRFYGYLNARDNLRLMGSELRVSSDPGRKTTFYWSMPIAGGDGA